MEKSTLEEVNGQEATISGQRAEEGELFLKIQHSLQIE